MKLLKSTKSCFSSRAASQRSYARTVLEVDLPSRAPSGARGRLKENHGGLKRKTAEHTRAREDTRGHARTHELADRRMKTHTQHEHDDGFLSAAKPTADAVGSVASACKERAAA